MSKLSKWKDITKEEKKEFVEVKIKIPKNCVAFIINYIEKSNDLSLNLGNLQYDTEDVKKMMEDN